MVGCGESNGILDENQGILGGTDIGLIVSRLGNRFGIRFWDRCRCESFEETTQIVEEGLKEGNHKEGKNHRDEQAAHHGAQVSRIF